MQETYNSIIPSYIVWDTVIIYFASKYIVKSKCNVIIFALGNTFLREINGRKKSFRLIISVFFFLPSCKFEFPNRVIYFSSKRMIQVCVDLQCRFAGEEFLLFSIIWKSLYSSFVYGKFLLYVEFGVKSFFSFGTLKMLCHCFLDFIVSDMNQL